jgi:porin
LTELRHPLLALLLLGLLIQAPLLAQQDEPQAMDTVVEVDPGTRPSFGGPGSVVDQLATDAEPRDSFFERPMLPGFTDWKTRMQEENGLTPGFDYSAVYLSASESLGEDDAAAGMLRFYGSWDLSGREPDSNSTGAFVWKIENRHKFSNIPPSDLGFATGYIGLHEPPFSDQKARVTNLYWRQRWDRLTLVAGFMDATDYVDVYAMASPWTGFMNFAFSTGTTTIPVPNDATLGVAVGAWLTDRMYVIGGIADTNSDPTDPFEGFNTFFDDREYFKHFEIGTTSSQDRIYLDNMHLTIWQVDERVRAMTPDGWGVNFSYTRYVNEKWLPFIRAGYADDGGSLMEKSLSVGVGYQPVPAKNLLGVGFNWGDPNESSFPGGLDDQYAIEVFYRINISDQLVVTPDVQLVKNPALNPAESTIWMFGLRARLAF